MGTWQSWNLGPVNLFKYRFCQNDLVGTYPHSASSPRNSERACPPDEKYRKIALIPGLESWPFLI